MVDFINEVEEELRKNQYNALLKKWGPLLIVGSVAIVVAAGVWEYMKSADERMAQKTSISYVAALDDMNAGDFAQASRQFLAIADQARPGYAGLSVMNAATIAMEQGNSDKAKDLFGQAATTFETPLHQDLASLKAAYISMHHGEYEDALSRAQPLSESGRAFEHLAREIKGMASMELGDLQTASSQFSYLARAVDVSGGVQLRAEQQLSLLAELSSAAAAIAAPTPVEPAGEDATPETQDTQP